jgi:hypothetical protein
MYKAGFAAGVQGYHNQCYHSGPGFIIDDETLTVVKCEPLIVVPQEERPMFQGA